MKKRTTLSKESFCVLPQNRLNFRPTSWRSGNRKVCGDATGSMKQSFSRAEVTFEYRVQCNEVLEVQDTID